MDGDDIHGATPVGDKAEADRALVDGWIDDLTQVIHHRLSERQLTRRLAGITCQRRRLVDRLSFALRMHTFRAQWSLRGRRESKALRRLDLALRNPSATTPPLTAVPSIEQLAYDLRRLDRQRRSQTVAQSERWSAAIMRAYDQRLTLACVALGLPEHLDALQGMDRDIERLRVETALRESGMRALRD